MVWVPLSCTFIPMEIVARLPTRHELWTNTTNATGRYTRNFGDYVWLKTVPLEHLRPSFHDPLGQLSPVWQPCVFNVGPLYRQHSITASNLFHFIKFHQNAVADTLSQLPLPSTFNEEDATYRVGERLVHSLPITHMEISYAHGLTQYYPERQSFSNKNGYNMWKICAYNPFSNTDLSHRLSKIVFCGGY